MERRHFIRGAASAGATATISGFPAPTIAQGKTEWRMVTTWPKNLPGPGAAAEQFAKSIGRATGGRLTIQVYAAGELVPAFEAFDAVQRGVAEVLHASTYFWQGKSQAMAFFATVPFGMTSTELSAWMRYGGGQELWNELYERFGLKGFHSGNTGVQMGGWFNKEINSLKDVKGLKIRMPGLGGEMMRRLGATVVNLPASEILPALQSGAIDATEWIGPFADLGLGIHRSARYYYWPGVHEPGNAGEISVSKPQFDELSDDIQRIFEAVAVAEHHRLAAEFVARNAESLDVLVHQHRVKLRRFPDEVLQGMGNAAGEVIAELRDTGDDLTRKIAESFIEHRRKLMTWTDIGELAFMQARNLPFKYAS